MRRYCVNCRLEKREWSTPRGFEVEGKWYCCIGCGYGGCLCIDKRPARARKVQISLATERI